MFFVALTAVTAMVIGNNVDAGLVGLVMSYVISVTGALNWVVRSASEVEQNIVSAERSECGHRFPARAHLPAIPRRLTH
jgi:hypothetical protein